MLHYNQVNQVPRGVDTHHGTVRVIAKTLTRNRTPDRMVNPDLDGLEGKWDKNTTLSKDGQLRIPTDSRLYAVQVTCNSFFYTLLNFSSFFVCLSFSTKYVGRLYDTGSFSTKLVGAQRCYQRDKKSKCTFVVSKYLFDCFCLLGKLII